MQSNLKAQLAAILGVLLLSAFTFAPYWVINYPIRQKTREWTSRISYKDSQLARQDALRGELKAYQQIPEKQEANVRYKKNIEATSIEAVQSVITKYPGISSLKTASEKNNPTDKDFRVTFISTYNVLGSVLTEIWNNYQFIDLHSVVVKANPTKPDEEVVVTLVIRIP